MAKGKQLLWRSANTVGYAALNYELCFQGPPLYKWKWLLNPFSFFRAAFGAEDVPSPDTTTLSGRRIYFSQVDSDGWNCPSKIERFRGSGAIAAEAVRQELIERFQDLPVTIDLQKNKGERFGRGAQHASTLERVLASPNVDLTQRSLRTTFSRFDSEYPSISNLSPLTRRGVDRDVDAALSDETAYVRVGADRRKWVLLPQRDRHPY